MVIELSPNEITSMEPNIAFIANLIGDAARSRMLIALMGGQALTATELALEADITPQTASSHLTKLVEGELLLVRKQGRHKYFQLQSRQVAELLESLLNMSAAIANPKVIHGPADPRLRLARVCYDHLAGELGVALYDSLSRQNLIAHEGSDTNITAAGMTFFAKRGVDLSLLGITDGEIDGLSYVPKSRQSRRPLCKSCLDWSERRSHLAGVLGQWILKDILAKGWAEKALDTRALQFSIRGLKSFRADYGIATK